jgi:hypothetical protein
MELPYCAIDISTHNGKLKLFVTDIDEGTEESRKRGGISADFNIQVSVPGINADFRCWVTLGYLYKFYMALRDCYNNLCGTAVLTYYSKDLTNISIDFNARGHCYVYGSASYKNNWALSDNRIEFGFECDQTYIEPNIKTLGTLFNELAAIQGSYEFLY